MQQIIVEVFGKKKNVTIDQLRDLVGKNYVSTDSPLTIDGTVCVISDVREQLEKGASTLTPPSAESPLIDPFANEEKIELPPPPKQTSEPRAKNDKEPSRSKTNAFKLKLVFRGIALTLLVSAFALSQKQEAPENQTRSVNNQSQGTNEYRATQNEKTSDVGDLSFDFDKYNSRKTGRKNRDNLSESTSNDKGSAEKPDFFKASSVFNVNWDEEDEQEANVASTVQPDVADDSFEQTTGTPEVPAPLLVVDHDKIFDDFFSYDARKNKIPSTVTINSPKQLEQALAKLEGKSRTIVLTPNSAPYELKSSRSIEGSITIKGESDDPSDATILVVPESTTRSGALEVSGGKLTLEGVTIKRNAPCSEEYALIAVDSKGEASIRNCVFDASGAEGGRGISVNGIGSSTTLESTTVKGFNDGVYAFNSSTLNVSNGCVFEENDRGATVANGAELTVSEATFTRNKIGVEVKTDGSGSLSKSSFKENDVPCKVDSYSEKKFKRTNNTGLD